MAPRHLLGMTKGEVLGYALAFALRSSRKKNSYAA